MTSFADKRVATAVVVALIAVISALRLVIDQPGPLFLIPMMLAGLWLGRWAGLSAGIACAALLTLTTELSGTDAGGVGTTVVRVGIYAGVGYVVGLLSESQLGLARKLEQREFELEELRTIQQALAPSEPPVRPALDLATCYIPAEHGVSGDFFIVAPAPDDSTLIAVGDVAGRGLHAAKRAWYVRTLITSSADYSENPSAVLERANSALIEESGYQAPFVTVACLLLGADGRLEWALAGHDAPVVLGRGSALNGDGASGLPLGVADELGCETSVTSLEHGSGVLLYTDGLTEARRRVNGVRQVELFGEERIRRLVARLGDAPSAAVVEEVRREASEFSGGGFADDLCLIAVRRASGPNSTEVC